MNQQFLFLINKGSSDQIRIDHIKAKGIQKEQQLRDRLNGVDL